MNLYRFRNNTYQRQFTMNLITRFEYSRAYGQFYVPGAYKCPPQAKIFKDFSTQNVLEAIC